LFVQWKFEVHQFGAFGVVNAGDVDVGAGERDVSEVEEEKSRLRGMRLDGFSGELRRLDFVALFLGDGAFHVLPRNGKRAGTGRRPGIGDPAVDVLGGGGSEFGMVGGDELDFHVADRNGLVAVVGNHEEDGKESVFVEVDGEKFGFVGSVVDISGNGDLIVGVIVMRGIGFGRAGGRLNEILGRERNGEDGDCGKGNGSAAKDQFQYWLHGSDYRGRGGIRERQFGIRLEFG